MAERSEEESSEEEEPTEEVVEEEAEEDVFIVYCNEYRTTATDVNDVVERIVTFATEQMKNSGKFSYGDKLMLNLKVSPAKKTSKDVKKEPCVVKAKPASKSEKAITLKK